MSIIVICPHCDCQVEILEINCAIFRHGVYKQTGAQMSSHATKSECDNAATQELINGCGKPFRIQMNENHGYEAIACDYI
jgi:hypothetical protein